MYKLWSCIGCVKGMVKKTIETCILERTEYPLWDKLVDSTSWGTIFHISRWLKHNENLVIYGCFKKDELVGGCPLFIKDGIFRTASSTFDMCPYVGIMIQDTNGNNVRKKEKHNQDIIQSLCKMFDKERFSRIDISFPPNSQIDLRPFIWNNWRHGLHYAYFFDLTNDIDKSISKTARNTITKAEKNNLVVKKLIDVDVFYNLYIDTYKRQDLIPPLGKSFFEDVLHMIKYPTYESIGQMWVAETSSGIPVASEIIFWDDNNCFRWAAAGSSELRYLGGTSLLLYHVFKDMKEHGFSSINLMGANTPHLSMFLSSFNPDMVWFCNVFKCSWFRDLLEYSYNKLKIQGE